jgi:L-2,4-diaminobutyric acid acetyltransferase
MSTQLVLRAPVKEDGMSVYQLIKNCPPLDVNSAYCNLLQCSHFSHTSVAADLDGELAGFVSGYRLPDDNSTLFIWQVAVGEAARGQGLASKMLDHILERNGDVKFIETTITETNKASWALFESLAKRLGVELDRTVMFDRDKHFEGEHDSEILARLGPING